MEPVKQSIFSTFLSIQKMAFVPAYLALLPVLGASGAVAADEPGAKVHVEAGELEFGGAGRGGVSHVSGWCGVCVSRVRRRGLE